MLGDKNTNLQSIQRLIDKFSQPNLNMLSDLVGLNFESCSQMRDVKVKMRNSIFYWSLQS